MHASWMVCYMYRLHVHCLAVKECLNSITFCSPLWSRSSCPGPSQMPFLCFSIQLLCLNFRLSNSLLPKHFPVICTLQISSYYLVFFEADIEIKENPIVNLPLRYFQGPAHKEQPYLSSYTECYTLFITFFQGWRRNNQTSKKKCK